MNQKTIAIIVAGGKGKRMGMPKQFLNIAGKPMLAWSLAAFEMAKSIDGIILVVATEQIHKAKKLSSKKILHIVASGKLRQDSVKNGLKVLPADTRIVVIHDGARPAITPEIIEKSIDAAKVYGAAVIGVPLKDTIKLVAGYGLRVRDTLNRDELWAAQTPQAFQFSIIQKGFENNRGKVTDDAMMVEKTGFPVKMVMGTYENIKVTTPEDIIVMEAILKARRK